jgi:hypothetical protein
MQGGDAGGKGIKGIAKACNAAAEMLFSGVRSTDSDPVAALSAAGSQ